MRDETCVCGLSIFCYGSSDQIGVDVGVVVPLLYKISVGYPLGLVDDSVPVLIMMMNARGEFFIVSEMVEEIVNIFGAACCQTPLMNTR